MLRKLCKGFLVLFVLLACWITYNSIDEPPRYDQSLLLPREQIPDEQNGFALLRYADREDGGSALLNGADSAMLRKVINDWEWDSQFAERVLKNSKTTIDLVLQVIARPQFRSDNPSDPYSASTSYKTALDLERLVLLKARSDEKNQNFDASIETASLAMRYCEKIRMDERGSLLSYLIGWHCIANVTDFYHELLSNNALSDKQFLSIENAMNDIADYQGDGFDTVMRGQFSQNKYSMDIYVNYGLIKRFGVLRDAIKEKRLCYDCKYSTLDIAYGYFNAIFIKYYLHSNSILNNRAGNVTKVISYAAGECKSLNESLIPKDAIHNWSDSKTLLDFLTPGSAGTAWFSGTYEDYVLRRCEFYNYLSAMKGTVAIARYKASHDGSRPLSLQQLLPDYANNLPLDFFSGTPLQYSQDTGWLYSTGLHHDNQNGSSFGFYKGRCLPKSDTPMNECDVKPTFPVNWNDYKFYEKLNMAEAGDACSQNYVGWMYQYGIYTKPDKQKAIYWYGMAADQNCPEAHWRLAEIYADKDSPEYNPAAALDRYRKSYKLGSRYARSSYATYLFTGSLGVTDYSLASSIFMKLASEKDRKYIWPWTNALMYNLHDMGAGPTEAAWFDYFIANPDLVTVCCNDPKDGVPELHRRLAEYYRWDAPYRNTVSESQKSESFWLNKAYEQYSIAGYPEEMAKVKKQLDESNDQESIKNLDKKISESMNAAPIQVPDQSSLCKNVFDHRHEDMARFHSVQQDIFRNKKKAKKLVANFNQEMKAKYQNSGMVSHYDNGTISIDFPAVSAKSLMTLLFDFADLDSRDSVLQFDLPPKEPLILSYGEKLLPAVTANLLLADMGLGADCSGGKIRFYIEDSTRLKPKLLAVDFIVDWAGLQFRNESLQGNGSLTFASGTRYKGEVLAGLPHGKGEYNFGGQVFVGDNFVDGMLYGKGEWLKDGHSIQRGEFHRNLLNGTGAIGYGYGVVVLEGNFKDHVLDGEGKATYFEADNLNTNHLALDNNYPPRWSFTGKFKDGQKTTGNCMVYRDRKPADTFRCEFFEDSLVKVGDVSLLPPDMRSPEELRKYLR
ncbi:MAG TPA: hypothetical protein PLF22_03865 [Pseudomonadales bacterium]|nr:hypothetical protein [Pseudomonadales bacterium]